MNNVIDAYSFRGSAQEAIADRVRERALSIDAPWQKSLPRSMRAGSAGVVVLIIGYVPYVPHVGTSPTVFDSRGRVRCSPTPLPDMPAQGARKPARQSVLRMSIADQAIELMAALNLNKTQCAELLGVSRQALYDWLGGMEPKAANAERLTSLLKLLAEAGVTAADSLSPRFVRAAMADGEPSLLDLLKADVLDEPRVAKILAEAKALEDEAENGRLAREDRLRQLGFEEPTAEQRKANLALNVALREWPKD